MADLYFYMWEFVTSMTIIILVAAYIIYDRFKIRYEALPEKEQTAKLHQLGVKTRMVLGPTFLIGGLGWLYFIHTQTLFISKELEGPHNYTPAIIMAIIGLIVFVAGIQKQYQKHS